MKQNRIKLKDAIEMLDLQGEDYVFIYIYNKKEDVQATLVKEIEKKLLSRVVKVIMPNHGGVDYNYSCYKFVLE